MREFLIILPVLIVSAFAIFLSGYAVGFTIGSEYKDEDVKDEWGDD